MIGTPLDVLPYVRGIQVVLTGYSGYTREKRQEVDKMIRDEIIRAAGRVRSHLENIHESAYRDSNIKVARAAKQAMEECDTLINDVEKAPAGLKHAFLSGQRSIGNADLKKLIKHDHDVIEMVTKATNIANSAEHEHASDGEEVIRLCRQTTQMLSSCRGFFGARANILNGLRRKEK